MEIVKFKDVNIVYGMDYYGDEVSEGAKGSVEYILGDLSDIRRSFFRLGFHLHELKQFRYYEEFGFDNIYDFAAQNFGMDKSAVSRCIGVFEMTAHYNGHNPSMFIQDKYKDYSYSQLSEMLSMREEDRHWITPKMTVKEIREHKKVCKERKRNDLNAAIDNLQDTLGKVATPQNRLCEADLCDLKGAALISKIRKADCIDVKHVTIFDEKGSQLLKCLTCDILLSDMNNIILRIVDPVEFNNGNDKCLEEFIKKVNKKMEKGS